MVRCWVCVSTHGQNIRKTTLVHPSPTVHLSWAHVTRHTRPVLLSPPCHSDPNDQLWLYQSCANQDVNGHGTWSPNSNRTSSYTTTLFFHPMATMNRGQEKHFIISEYSTTIVFFSSNWRKEEMWLGQDDLHRESGALSGMTGAAQNAVNLPFYPLRIRKMLLVWNLWWPMLF